MIVRCGDADASLLYQSSCLFPIQRSIAFEEVCHIAAANKLHGNESDTRFGGHVEYGDDVRIGDSTCVTGFGQQTIHHAFVLADCRRKYLEGNVAKNHTVTGLVNNPHPAATNDLATSP